jgi:hypothetical protein
MWMLTTAVSVAVIVVLTVIILRLRRKNRSLLCEIRDLGKIFTSLEDGTYEVRLCLSLEHDDDDDGYRMLHIRLPGRDYDNLFELCLDDHGISRDICLTGSTLVVRNGQLTVDSRKKAEDCNADDEHKAKDTIRIR